MRKENKNGSTTRSDAQINRDIILQEIHASIAAEYYCITVVVDDKPKINGWRRQATHYNSLPSPNY